MVYDNGLDALNISFIIIKVHAFSNAVFGQGKMMRGFNSLLSQAVFYTMQGTAIKRDDFPAALCFFHQLANATADSGNPRARSASLRVAARLP